MRRKLAVALAVAIAAAALAPLTLAGHHHQQDDLARGGSGIIAAKL